MKEKMVFWKNLGFWEVSSFIVLVKLKDWFGWIFWSNSFVDVFYVGEIVGFL